MYYVLQTFSTKSFQVVQSTKRNFAAFYGKVLFECQEKYLAETVLKSYQLAEPPKYFASRFSPLQLASITRARKKLNLRLLELKEGVNIP